MTRALRLLLYLCAGLVLLATSAAGWLRFTGLPTYPVRRVDLTVERTPERVTEGRRLTTMMCVPCHRDQETGTLSGREISDVPAVFGRFYSANITHDPVNGIPAWTDGQLAWLLRTGVRPDGRLAVVMPAFPGLDDEELADIIAFLRSDDPLVAATSARTRPPEPSLFGKALARLVFKPHAMPDGPTSAPPRTDRVSFGRYLALRRLQCYGCHSADFAKNDDEVPERSAGFFGGGNELLDADGAPIYSANITADLETGIGRWSEADFRRAIKGGIRPDNVPLRSPMPIVPELTDEEAASIYAYLRTVPRLRNPRRLGPQRTEAAAAGSASRGQAVYNTYCAGCHGTTGRQTFDLTRAGRDFRTHDELKAWIRRPAAFRPWARMPEWDGILREEDIDAVAAYVRVLGDQNASR